MGHLVSAALEELFVFFFNDTATTEIYTLSLHDALPISFSGPGGRFMRLLAKRISVAFCAMRCRLCIAAERLASRCRCPSWALDRKSTRLNSSHANISYAVFCLKKKKYIIPHIYYYLH